MAMLYGKLVLVTISGLNCKNCYNDAIMADFKAVKCQHFMATLSDVLHDVIMTVRQIKFHNLIQSSTVKGRHYGTTTLTSH